jgi:hypothetical protein
MLCNEMTDRSADLEQFLLEMMATWDFSGDFIRTVFAPPFAFADARLLQFVVNAAVRQKLQPDCVLSFLERCVECPERLTLLIGLFPRERGDQLIEIVLERGNEFHRQYLVAKLVDFCVSEGKLAEILRQCHEKSELFRFALLADSKGAAELLRDALLAFLACDRDMTVREQLELYLNALNLIAGLTHADAMNDLLIELVANLKQIGERTRNPLFPLLSNGEQKHCVRLVKGVIGSPALQTVAKELQEFIDCIQSNTGTGI